VTDPHPLFRFIWRVNALVILGVGLVAGAVASWGLIQIARDIVRPRAIEGVMRVPDADQREIVSLGSFTPAPGGRYLVGTVSGEQEGFEAGYSKTIGSTRDLVILDRVSNTIVRLLGRTDQVILSWSYPVADGEKPVDPSMLLVTLVDADSNGDKRLDGADRRTLLACLPSGADCKPLLAGIDSVLTQSVRADGRVDLVTSANGTIQWRVIAVDRALGDAIAIPDSK